MTPEQAARAIQVAHIDGTGLIDWEATLINIKQALLAAEQRGLERAAEIAEVYGGVAMYALKSPEVIAQAIRQAKDVKEVMP